jgi:hypothetical protein
VDAVSCLPRDERLLALNRAYLWTLEVTHPNWTQDWADLLQYVGALMVGYNLGQHR